LKSLRYSRSLLGLMVIRSGWRLLHSRDSRYYHFKLREVQDFGRTSYGREEVIAEGSTGVVRRTDGKIDVWAVYDLHSHTVYDASAIDAQTGLQYSRHALSLPDDGEGLNKAWTFVAAAQLIIGRRIRRDMTSFRTLSDLHCAMQKGKGHGNFYSQFRLEKRLPLAINSKKVKTMHKLLQASMPK